MILDRCPWVWGETQVVEADPSITYAESALYVPFTSGYWYDNDPFWGLYGEDGRLIEDAAYYRTEHEVRRLFGQSPVTDVERTGLAEADEAEYLYVGPLIGHYGHFLLDTLCRFWPIVRDPAYKTSKMLVHGYGAPRAWFDQPFISQIFGMMGLTPDRFVTFEAPTRVRRVTIPRASFELNGSGHPVFVELCRSIAGVAGRAPAVKPPAYLSRARLAQGNQKVVNEGELETALQARGFEIIHPERLDVRSQIQVFAEREVVVGPTGSAFHTSAFVTEPRRLVCLNTNPTVNSNFPLLDKLAGHHGTYHYPKDGMQVAGADGPEFRIEDPEGWAKEITALAV